MTAHRSPERTRHSPSFPPPNELWRRLVEEADAVDNAVYDAVARTPTPTLDVPMTVVSNAANYSGIWLVTAGLLALVGGQRGRRAAARGLVAIGATSATANLAAKRLFPRRRPVRSALTAERRAAMPSSASFPSGHTASAFAFATAVTADLPQLALPLYGLATVVGYSRVHNGVHYPGDVMGGAVLGLTTGTAIRQATLRPGRRLTFLVGKS
jgi:membrane-associated phospholipid phosphatase